MKYIPFRHLAAACVLLRSCEEIACLPEMRCTAELYPCKGFLIQYMLDVVVFKINKYNGEQARGNHKATGERTQHQFVSFKSLARHLRQ